ncbi:MAG: hypothetical protein JWM14_862 [Chitinophagaceae bacterium]|nr:hypothetical protein [Chitinophagaceae bacterium]
MAIGTRTSTDSCECHKLKQDIIFICNGDTTILEKDFLFSDNVTYSVNRSLDSLILSTRTTFANENQYCYSSKYNIKDGYYLIQRLSHNGSTNLYILGNSNSERIEIYTLAWSTGFTNRTYVDEFLEKIKSKCSKRQFKELHDNIERVTMKTQKRFPVFAK